MNKISEMAHYIKCFRTVPRAVFQTNIEENQRDMKSCEVRAGETLLCGAYWDRWRLSVLSD